MIDRRPWSQEETDTLYRMVVEGKTIAQICAALDRRDGSVRSKIKDDKRSPEQKKLARQARTLKQGELRRKPLSRAFWLRTVGSRPQDRPTPEMLLDREIRRALLPRNLSAALFGDPLPGYSALERRA